MIEGLLIFIAFIVTFNAVVSAVLLADRSRGRAPKYPSTVRARQARKKQ